MLISMNEHRIDKLQILFSLLFSFKKPQNKENLLSLNILAKEKLT